MSSFISSSGLTYLWSKIKEYISAHAGTYSKPSTGIPKTDLASAVQTSLGKADTALQSYTETDPTVPSWAKQSSKPTYTASEVGALPDTTAIPTESTVSGWGFTKNTGTITGITMNGSSKGTSGVVNLGTVITAHQDISGKANKATTLAGYGITDAHTKTEDYSKFDALSGGSVLNYSASNPIDLNSLTTVGNYCGTFVSAISYVTNRPVNRNAAFRLWISEPSGAVGSAVIKQKFQYYDQTNIYERYTSNSGSSWSVWRLTTLPTVTSTDNGKILQVESGAWTVATSVAIYTGSTAPSSSTGSDGDIYIQTS